MKTKPKITRSRSASLRIVLPAILSVLASFVARPLFAQAPDHQLVMTENSPSSLTVTYDGSAAGISVVPGAADTWLVTFPTTTHLGFELDWQEPENSGVVNDFNIYPPDIGVSNTWIVSSEFMLPGGAAQDMLQPPDGHTFTDIGGDLRDETPIDVTFHDVAADAVPEPATWISLIMGSAMLALMCGRKRPHISLK